MAIEEQMDGFELGVGQPDFNPERNLRAACMGERLKVRHQIQYTIGEREHESRIARAGTSNPVLGSTEFTRLLGADFAPRDAASRGFPV